MFSICLFIPYQSKSINLTDNLNRRDGNVTERDVKNGVYEECCCRMDVMCLGVLPVKNSERNDS